MIRPYIAALAATLACGSAFAQGRLPSPALTNPTITGGTIAGADISQANVTPSGGAQTTLGSALTGASLGSTLAIPAIRLGQVATATEIPQFINPALKQFMARSNHFMRQSVSQLQVVFSNFVVGNGTSSGDIGTGGPATVTASVEYPIGTFHQLTFSGSVTGTIADMSVLASDVLPISIPNGAQIAVREWYSNPVAIPYVTTTGGISRNSTGAVLHAGASGIADQTMGGTISNSGANIFNYPAAIIAPSSVAAGCLIGDSRVEGISDNLTGIVPDAGPIARAIGPKYAYINMGISGDSIAGAVTSSSVRQILAQYCTFMIDEYGINDLSGGATSAAVVANRNTFEARFPNLVIYGATLEPESSSTDSWATTGNQTVKSWEANRITFNASVRAGLPAEVDFIDIARMIDPTDSGKWPVTGAAGGCTLDGVHEINISALLSRTATACGPFINPFGGIDFNRH